MDQNDDQTFVSDNFTVSPSSLPPGSVDDGTATHEVEGKADPTRVKITEPHGSVNWGVVVSCCCVLVTLVLIAFKKFNLYNRLSTEAKKVYHSVLDFFGVEHEKVKTVTAFLNEYGIRYELDEVNDYCYFPFSFDDEGVHCLTISRGKVYDITTGSVYRGVLS